MPAPGVAEVVEPKAVTQREFKGVNVIDARQDIDDQEFAWLENAIPVGKGSVRLTPAQGAVIATLSQGITSLHGFNLDIGGVSMPVLMAVGTDGSLTQIKTDGTTTVAAAAGSITSGARLAIWRTTPILIVDATNGYRSWDGAAFSTIAAGQKHDAIAVFEGRVWLGKNRTITFTAPNTNNDFNAANGAGSTIVTDEAFPGPIIGLESALEQLWVVGQGAVDALTNVTTSGGTTSFSITNIITNVGSNSYSSIIGFFRSLAFMAQFGAYALVGVTPQKLSDKLDGIFPGLTLSGETPAAVGNVYNILVLCFLTTYTQSLVPDRSTPASGSAAATSLLLCFAQGKWFFSTQGSLAWITSLLVSGVPQIWGCTAAGAIYRLFADSTTAVTYKIVSKFYDFGESYTIKEVTHFRLEFQAPATINPVVTIDNEQTGVAINLAFSSTVTWINQSNQTVAWQNSTPATVTWLSTGLVLASAGAGTASQFGQYLGYTLTGTDPAWLLSKAVLEVMPRNRWPR